MEDSWEDLFSIWEMGDDDLFNQSHMRPFNEEGDYLPPNIPSSCSSLVQSNVPKPFSSSIPTGGYVLSYDNPVVQQHHDTAKSKARTRSHCNIEPKETQKPRTNTQDHILAERKRREELTKSIIALSATIPGLKKRDKINVLREAVNYMKQLQERVKELENEMRLECVTSTTLTKNSKTPLSINDQSTHRFVDVEELPEVKVTVLDNQVLIGIIHYCDKQRKSFLKIMSLLDNLHLSITSTSVLPFGTSILKITIVAKMNEEYNMTIDDLVKTLRQRILSLKSQDMQK